MTNKDDFMKKVIIGMFIFLIIFTIGIMVEFYYTGSVPDTLVKCVFGACMGEYSICGLLKHTKEKEKTKRLKDNLIEEEPEDDDMNDIHDENNDEEAID